VDCHRLRVSCRSRRVSSNYSISLIRRRAPLNAATEQWDSRFLPAKPATDRAERKIGPLSYRGWRSASCRSGSRRDQWTDTGSLTALNPQVGLSTYQLWPEMRPIPRRRFRSTSPIMGSSFASHCRMHSWLMEDTLAGLVELPGAIPATGTDDRRLALSDRATRPPPPSQPTQSAPIQRRS
jgi:hypothetical protein